jgi:hypothetical protein
MGKLTGQQACEIEHEMADDAVPQTARAFTQKALKKSNCADGHYRSPGTSELVNVQQACDCDDQCRACSNRI